MKIETAELLQKYIHDNKFEFIELDDGLELQHTLTDEEKSKLVHLEYGSSLSGTVDDLFVAIIRKVIRLAVEKAKEEYKDKLTEL